MGSQHDRSGLTVGGIIDSREILIASSCVIRRKCWCKSGIIVSDKYSGEWQQCLQSSLPHVDQVLCKSDRLGVARDGNGSVHVAA